MALLQCGFIWWHSSCRVRLQYERSALRDLFQFSGGYFGFSFVNYWSRNADNFVIGKFLGPESLGFYSRAYQLMLLPVSFITSTASQVMFPALSTVQNDLPRLRRIYLDTIEGVALITFPLMLGLLVTAGPFIDAVFSEKWRPAIPVLQVLCLVGLEQSIISSTGLLFMVSGRTDIFFRFGVFASLAAIASFAIGLHWGILGVAIAYAVCDLGLLAYPAVRLAGGLVGLRPTEMARKLAPVFGAAALMAACVWLAGRALKFSAPAQLAAQIAIGVVSYPLFLFALRVPAWLRVWTQLRRHAAGNAA
jgi:PST family polysaccharide transporter